VRYVLDTDFLTILQYPSSPAHAQVQARLHKCEPNEVATTAISFQERIQGWLAVINRPRTPARLLQAYTELLAILRDFSQMNVLPYDERAHNRYLGLTRQRIRIGTLDLRIASIALAHRATLVTRNLRHFRQVPNLEVEDWTH
jgi:tRNA(fMet)-specific endonuclease VapC